jgi:hypothetical protein
MEMVSIKVAEATGPALDYLVALTQGWEPRSDALLSVLPAMAFSSDWRVGGPLLPRRGVRVDEIKDPNLPRTHEYQAEVWSPYAIAHGVGEGGYLIAAMRAIVIADRGETAPVPASLVRQPCT